MRREIVGKSIIDLLFPRKCVVCGKELLLFERHLCMDCIAELPLTYFWKYRENPAALCLTGRAKIENVYSLFYYSGEYKKILHSLKYRSNVPLARHMGRMLGEKIKKCGAVYDYIVPVPLHFIKKWKRGYNQSHIIAGGIKRGLGCGSVAARIIKRTRFTGTQTKKEKIERWINVRGAFALCNDSPHRIARYSRLLEGKNILLVDDVFTTGATLNACCQLLNRFGCKITIATLAYVE